jgi:hypothetical protein
MKDPLEIDEVTSQIPHLEEEDKKKTGLHLESRQFGKISITARGRKEDYY